MRITPELRADLARWNAAVERARRAYEAGPDLGARTFDGECAICPKPVSKDGLCHRHHRLSERRDRGEVGAA